MPHNSHQHQTPRQDDYIWTVDFSLRIDNEQQRRVVSALGIGRVHDVVKLWMEVIIPSHVVEQNGTLIRQIRFRRRSDMRRFMKVWGGQAVTSSPLSSSAETVRLPSDLG
jgi:hypothetical protein